MRASFYEMSIIEVADVKGGRSDAKDIDPIECVMQLKASMKNRVGGIKSSERNVSNVVFIQRGFYVFFAIYGCTELQKKL